MSAPHTLGRLTEADLDAHIAARELIFPPGLPLERAVAANDPIVPDSMWADEVSNRWLVPAYFAVFFGTLLLCHACARGGS